MLDRIAQLQQAVRTAVATGRLDEARRCAVALRQIPEGMSEGLFLEGIVEAEAGRVSTAVQLIREAAALSPNADNHAQLARLLALSGNDIEAGDAAARAEALGPRTALTFDTIGCVHTRLGAHASAARLFMQAVAITPENHNFRYNLAIALSFTGDIDAAERHLDIIVAAEPLNGRGHLALSGLRRQSKARNHVKRLQDALAEVGAGGDQLRIRYALAKELEECGQPDEAFHQLHVASAQRRSELAYDFTQDAANFDTIESLFEGDPIVGDGDAAMEPVFVVGMPRTGTTLADRILSSHPQMQSAGELLAMPLTIRELAGGNARSLIDPVTFERSRRLPASTIADRYLARARRHHGADGPRFIDKLPFNFFYLGFIMRAFPNARIVCLRRHPMDTVWSNYKHMFADNSPFHRFSYDPLDIARYYLRFDALITFWKNHSPGRILELGYEALVMDQESETRRLLDHCQLKWDQSCMRFDEQSGAVATASAAQVRQPMNADAVGRWRPHADALASAARLFQAARLATD